MVNNYFPDNLSSAVYTKVGDRDVALYVEYVHGEEQ